MNREDDNQTFLNLLVQKVDPSNIQEFMRSWMRQQCKDFKLVFIQKKDASKEEKQAITYACGFASAIGQSELIAVVASEEEVPKAKITKILKDTSILPVDKLEVLKMRTEASKKIKDQKIETKNVIENKQELVEKNDATKIMLQQKPMKDEVGQKKEVEKTKDAKPIEKVFFKIIVPNYNNMPYIKKCLDSILEQSFQDFKIIVVDDLSTDGSDKFCEMYARKHFNKIIFQRLKKKGYAGAARNAGLDYKIDSSYTWFIDSDDWMYDNNVLKRIYDTIIKNGYPDVVRCSLKHLFSSKDSRVDVLGTSLNSIFMSGAGPCKSCIKSSIPARFQECRAKLNDVMWLLRVIDNINPKKIALVKSPCQVYNRMSSTSCQNSPIVFSMPQCIAAKKQLIYDLQKETFKTKACQNEKARLLSQIGGSMKDQIPFKQLMMNSFVISIDFNKYQLFTKIFTSAGLVPIPKMSAGCIDQNLKPFQRCTRSHVDLIKKAKSNNWPYILVFEDDAYPCIDCSNKFEQYLKCIPKDASMVILGWSACQKRLQRFDQIFNKVTTWTISGSHAYILFKSGYDQYLKFFANNKEGRADNNIYQAVKNSYILSQPLFIQYSQTKSMNNHIGYIFYGDHDNPPQGFQTINEVLKNE